MRPSLIAVPLVTVLLGLSACTSTPEPTTSSASAASATTTAAPSATASPSPSPSPSPTTTAAAVKVPTTIQGLHIAGVQDGAWPDANVPFGGLRLWDNGTAWSQIETVKGTYNWALLDRSVANAEKHGIRNILLVLGSTPSWNARQITAGDYPVPGAASPPRSMAAWDAFVKAVATRYKGRINGYQVWNEASLAMFWNGTPEKMAELTKHAYDIIKSVDKKATVVSASTTVRLEGAFNRYFPRYLDALKQYDWPVDVYAAHLYPASKGSTDNRAAFITQVYGALAAAGAPTKPVWDTELNYGLAGPGPTNPKQDIAGAKARDWVVQTTFDSLALGISRTYWYIWTPKPYPLLGLQLTNDSGAVKGMRVVEQWIVGGTTTGCSDEAGVTSCAVEKNSVPSLIAWADDRSATFTAPDGFTQACTTANECTDITGPLELDETPIRLVP